MARDGYRGQLAALREDVLEMSDRVFERLERALEALGRQDDAVATAVTRGDHAINVENDDEPIY